MKGVQCVESAVWQARLVEAVEEYVNSGAQPAESMIRDLIECEHSYINTDHPDFIGGSRAIAQVGRPSKPGSIRSQSFCSSSMRLSKSVRLIWSVCKRTCPDPNAEHQTRKRSDMQHVMNAEQLGHSMACRTRYLWVSDALQVMERRQAAAEEAEEQGSEGSGRDAGPSHRNTSKHLSPLCWFKNYRMQGLKSIVAVSSSCSTSEETNPVKPAEQSARCAVLAFGAGKRTVTSAHLLHAGHNDLTQHHSRSAPNLRPGARPAENGRKGKVRLLWLSI